MVSEILAGIGLIILYVLFAIVAIFCIVTAGVVVFFTACGTIAFWSWLFHAGDFVSVCLR